MTPEPPTTTTTTSQLYRYCDCGCGRKFLPPPRVPGKRFALPECKDRYYRQLRREALAHFRAQHPDQPQSQPQADKETQT